MSNRIMCVNYGLLSSSILEDPLTPLCKTNDEKIRLFMHMTKEIYLFCIYTESCVLSCLLCNLSSKNQIRKLGDTKYQTGKYQIGKYLASFAWTSVAQLAEVSKPGIARERDGQGDFSPARNLPSSSWAGSQASNGARRPRWLRWRPASRTAPNSLGGAAAPRQEHGQQAKRQVHEMQKKN